MDAVLAALITALVGGPVVYGLGKRRLRFERLYERRAEVIARLSELLYEMQRSVVDFASPVQNSGVDRNQQMSEANRAFDELVHYCRANSIWLDRETCEKLEKFMETSFKMVGELEDSLNERLYPQGKEGRDISLRVVREIPPLRRELENEFRAILYPPAWYEILLRIVDRNHTQSTP